MKQLNLLLASTILLVLSGVCLYIILWHTIGMQQFIGISVALFNNFWGNVLIIAVGFVCLGCGLSLLSQFVGLDPADRPHIMLNQEGGVVGVSLDAVEEYIKRKALMVDGVRDVAVRAQMTDEGISLLTRVTLELQRNIPDFIHSFQNRIQYELTETLGLQKVKEIQILIHKILPKESGEGRLLGPPSPVLLKEPEPAASTHPKAEVVSGDAYLGLASEEGSELMETQKHEETT
jgi:uncharacterized alkaline shock family protein YloU